MTSYRQPAHRVFAPLAPPATPASSRRAAAARIGGYGGVAVAAWLVAAVATGYGISAADTDGASNDATSASSKTSSKGESSTGPAAADTSASGKVTGGDAGPASGRSAESGSKVTDKPKASGSSASNIQIAPGVTISSSGGAHRIKVGPRDLKISPAHPKTHRQTDDAAGVEAQPDSLEPAAESKSSRSASDGVADAFGAAESKLSTAVSKLSTAIDVDHVLKPVRQLSETVTESVTASTAQVLKAKSPGSALQTQVATAAVTPVSPATGVAEAGSGVFGFVNTVVTDLLNPFLAPAPDTPEPVTPMVWALLAWVRRNAFNQSPTVSYDPATTVQTGQTVTGNIGAADVEGDALTYTVTQQPEHGTVTIDQATGNYTYTPDDIDYDAAQTDSFTVSVSDGKTNLLDLFSKHTAQQSVDVMVLNPTVERVILDMPEGVTNPANPRFSEDGNSIYFAGQPTAGGRTEIYQISVDGSHVECVTCGVSTGVTGNLAKPVPFTDGSGRVLVLVQNEGQSPQYSVLEDGVDGRELVSITTPDGGGYYIIDRQREMRPSPDGTHVLYTRIVLGPNNLVQALPIVGTLTRTDDGYVVEDARVVYPTGEGKQWTPDGKGVVILGGAYEAGNVDDIEVDLATGEVRRVTANLDYDEDMDYSPNQQWIAIGSTRGLDALTPMTRVVRPNFLPTYVSAPVYEEYAVPVNVSNQEWAVAVEDELNRENGIPLFDTGDGYAARSMPSWNPDGTAVTFWESGVQDPTQTRLVIANLKYTTSVGPVATDRSTPNPDWAPALGSYVASTTPLPAAGTYAGAGGGTAVVSEAPDPTDATRTIRTVTYTDYVNEDGMILNGTESADYAANQNDVHYLADITVTGTHTGYLKADATMNAFQQSLTGYITSDIDGDVQTLPNGDDATEAQQNA